MIASYRRDFFDITPTHTRSFKYQNCNFKIMGGKSDSDSFSAKKFWTIFGLVFAVLFLCSFAFFGALIFTISGSSSSGNDGNVAVIPLEGVIVGSSSGSGVLGGGGMTSQDYVNLIGLANEDDSIEAIVIEINSPGGSAVASDEIARAVLASEKPTVAMIREVGASGGYWVASATDHVVANRMSITGSIGVISSYLEFSDLMEDYGVSYERLVAGENKDVGNPFTSLGDDGRELLESKLGMIHDYFIDAVAKNRGLPREKVVELATGEFYLGVEALELGLVDALGSELALEEYLLSEEVGLEEIKFTRYSLESGFLESLFGVINERSFNLGLGIGSGLSLDLESGQGFEIIV